MGKESLLVLFCRDTLYSSNNETQVYDFHNAVDRLRESEGLELAVDSKVGIFSINSISNHKKVAEKGIGSYAEFKIFRPGREEQFLVGVYNQIDLSHIRNMVSAVTHKERSRAPSDISV